MSGGIGTRACQQQKSPRDEILDRTSQRTTTLGEQTEEIQLRGQSLGYRSNPANSLRNLRFRKAAIVIRTQFESEIYSVKNNVFRFVEPMQAL
jgi:hypothetical protein